LDPVRFGELLAIVEQLKSVLPEHWGGRIVCEES